MAYCQSLNRWGQCRWDLKHFRSVPMIRSLSRTVCCRFANPTANLTVIRIANPFAIRFVIRFANLIASQNRIDCQIHFVSRFANRYH